MPFDVPFEVSDWPPPVPVPMTGSLRITLSDLARAAVMVGRWPGDVGAYGRHSVADALHRTTCVRAYYVVTNGRLCHSPMFRVLDPTEKAIASYYLGMAATKIFAEKELGVPWLAHLSRYGARWTVDYVGSKRPDLFGPNAAGRWVVAEAKGRVRIKNALVTSMKNQKSSVASINGAPPFARLGSATQFRKGELELRVVDPPPKRRALHFELDLETWIARYYSPVMNAISRRPANRRDGHVYGHLDDADLEIGIPAWLYSLLSSRQDQAARPETSAPTLTATSFGPDLGTNSLSRTPSSWLDEFLSQFSASEVPEQVGDRVAVLLGDSWEE